jgi:hypothetical protein
MEPASTVIAAFGGPNAVAEILGIHRTNVASWKRPKAKRGTGGRIPVWHAEKLLAEAKSRGLALTAESFFRPMPAPQSETPQ